MAPFEVGKFVEATPYDPKMKDSYFSAQITGQLKDKFFVTYLTLTDDQGINTIHLLPKWLLRPIPPLVFAPLFIGDEVDVFVFNGWWKGTITGFGGGLVAVHFGNWGENGVFEMGQIRIHQTWSKKSPSYWKYKKMD